MERDLWGGVVLIGLFVVGLLGWAGWLPRGIRDLLSGDIKGDSDGEGDLSVLQEGRERPR